MKKVILSVTLVASMIAMTHVQDVNAMNEQPATTIITGEDGFVDAKLEDLSPAVQDSINALTLEYDVEALKYNAEKQLTKVKLIKKDDQSKTTVYFDAEGNKVKNPSMKAEKVKEKVEEQLPSAEISYGMQDDGYVDIKFEALNEKVQEAVRALSEKYDLTALKNNAEKKLFKVVGTSKEDKTEKTFYLNENGEEVNLDAAPVEKEVTEAPELL